MVAAWAGLLFLPACSGVIEDAEQPITVFTDPPGAYCILSRRGDTVGIIPRSPGLLRVKNSKHDISLRCSKALHEDATGVLASSRRDITIGDIVVKGAIGLAVDAGIGASHEYLPSITLYLPPKTFQSAKARDSHYDRMKAEIADHADRELGRIELRCGKTLTGYCRKKMKAIEAARDATVADLEAKRRRARIARG